MNHPTTIQRIVPPALDELLPADLCPLGGDADAWGDEPDPTGVLISDTQLVGAWLIQVLTRGGRTLTAPGPVIYPPGYHADGWTIAYESDEEWTVPFCALHARLKERMARNPSDTNVVVGDRRRTAATRHLFLEPINHWLLGIYLDH